MRLLIVESFYGNYLEKFYQKRPWLDSATSLECQAFLLEDRFDAPHIFEPVYNHDPDVRFVVFNDERCQRKWAVVNGLRTVNLEDILVAQIEEHRSEVVYWLAPQLRSRNLNDFLKGRVKKNIIWSAAPQTPNNYDGVDLVLSSHKQYLEHANEFGIESAYFTPSLDPQLVSYSANTFRPIDICFVGSYSPAHSKRNKLLEKLSELASKYRIVLGLMRPRPRRLSSIPFLSRFLNPSGKLPKNLQKISCGPVFGRDLYTLFSHSKIIINASVDLTVPFRGNMRCYEAMGCGACMLSDEGIYPQGMESGVTFVSYSDEDDMCLKVEKLLFDGDLCRSIGQKGAEMLSEHYSKPEQWIRFRALMEKLCG